MAAEDWLPDEDPEDPDSDWNYPRSHFHTCKRCGSGGLHWRSTERGWRLFSGNEMHICASPTRRSLTKAERLSALNTSLSTPITKESPIMDKNAVAFIRNDIRSIEVIFPKDGDKLDPALASAKHYTYLTNDPSIITGDWVVVLASTLKTAFVVSTSTELEIEPNAAFQYQYVVGKIDFAPYNALLKQNAAISDLINSSYKETIRRGFRETLLSGLPQDKQSSITLILNKE